MRQRRAVRGDHHPQSTLGAKRKCELFAGVRLRRGDLVGASHEQHRHAHAPQDPLGHATQHEPPDPAATMRCHRHQIDVLVIHEVDDPLCRIAKVNLRADRVPFSLELLGFPAQFIHQLRSIRLALPRGFGKLGVQRAAIGIVAPRHGQITDKDILRRNVGRHRRRIGGPEQNQIHIFRLEEGAYHPHNLTAKLGTVQGD